MGCYVRVTKTTWDVMSGVTKTAWDVLSRVANLWGMFCQGCQKMAWDILSRDVLSGSLENALNISTEITGPRTHTHNFADWK